MKMKNKEKQKDPIRNKRNKNPISAKQRLYTSFLLMLLALVAVTAATVAWFSIADNTKVKSMSLDIVSGVDLRMDLDPHKTLEEYVKTLSFDQIAERIQKEKGFSMKETPLEPVTTQDEEVFTFENGTIAESTSGVYLEFTLHFMAAKDMVVHLTSADSSETAGDGTEVLSENAALPASMRISFSTDGKTWIYDPGMGNISVTEGNTKNFGLPEKSMMELNEDNAMFSMKEGINKEVKVHIWMEGTDPACNDGLKGADYAIRLRFTGTDENGQPFSEQ